jgi:hypothetical protein
MAGTTRLELATSAVTEHLDLEFQGLTGAGRNEKRIEEQKGTLIVPELFPDSSVGIPKPTSGRIGTDAEQTSHELGPARWKGARLISVIIADRSSQFCCHFLEPRFWIDS